MRAVQIGDAGSAILEDLRVTGRAAAALQQCKEEPRRLQRGQALLEVPPVRMLSLEVEVAVAQRLGEMA